MMRKKDNMSAWELYNLRKRISPEVYVEEMSKMIEKDLCETANSEAAVRILNGIHDVYLYHDVKAIAIAAKRLGQQIKDREAAYQRALTEHQHSMQQMRAEYERELQRVRSEHEQIRLEAVAIRRQAEMDAQQTRAEAMAEKRTLMNNVNAVIEQDRERCLEAARREAAQEKERMLEEARQLAYDVYDELRDHFTPDAIRDAVDGYRQEDSAAYAATAEQNRRAVDAFENVRTAFSSGMTGMQAQMNEQLKEMQNSLSRSMMDWREQLYRMETMDLAQCAVNLSTIIAGIDKRVSEAAMKNEPYAATGLAAVRRNISRFEKQFRNALTGVGLEVYQPQPGDRFDSARHVLSDAEKDVDPDWRMAVSACIRPGVLGNTGKGVEALIRAEVEAERLRYQPDPEPVLKPVFNQIVPGGDQE